MIKWLLIISFLAFNCKCAVVCPRYLNVVPVQAIATPNDRLCCTGNNMQTAYQDAPQTYDDGSLKVATYLQTHVNNGMLVSNKMEVLSHQGSNNVVNSNIRVQNISQNQPVGVNSPGFFNNQNPQMNPQNLPMQSSTSAPLIFTPTPNGWSDSSFNNNQPINVLGQQYPTTSNSQNMNGQTVNNQNPAGVTSNPMANNQWSNNPTANNQMFNGESVNIQVPNGQMPNGQMPNGQAQNGQMPNGQMPNGQMQNGQIPNDQTTNGQMPNSFTQFPQYNPQADIYGGQVPNNYGNQPVTNSFGDSLGTTVAQPVTAYNNPTQGNGNIIAGGQFPIYSTEQGSSVPSTPNGFSTTSIPYNQNQQQTTMRPTIQNMNQQNTMNTQNPNGYVSPQENTNRNFDYTSSTSQFSPSTQRPFTNGVQQSSSDPSYYMSTQFPNNMPNNFGNINNVSPANSNPNFIQNEGINYVPSASSTVSTNGYSSPSTLYTSQGTSSSPFIMSNINDPNRGQTQLQSTTPFYPSSSNTQQMQTVNPYTLATTTLNGRVDSSASTSQYNPSNPILSTSSIPTSYSPNGDGIDQFPTHVLYDNQRMMNTQFGDYTNAKQTTSVVISLIIMYAINLAL